MTLACAGLGVAGAVAWSALGDAPRPSPREPVDAPVVLAQDPPEPPSVAPTPDRSPARVVSRPGEPVARVDVVCSDLHRRSVPVTEVGTDEPGALVELGVGPCVVMGPDGAVVP